MEFIKLVTNKLTIQKIIVDREKLSKDLINFAFWNDISLLYYDELKLQGFLLNEYDLALTFGFGHKFSLQEIEAYQRGIWNFHPGKLPIYRGRHPISHAMINFTTFDYLKNKYSANI